MKEIYIYLDMDGCCADWEKSVLEHSISDKYELRDIVVLNKHPNRKVIIDEMYQVTPDFFRNLPLIDEYLSLMKYLVAMVDKYSYIDFKFSFLTCVGDIHHDFNLVENHKKDWLQEHLGGYLSRLNIGYIPVLHSGHKSEYANEASVLIDDYHRNISEWNAQGGYGIEFNRHNIGGVIENLNKKISGICC